MIGLERQGMTSWSRITRTWVTKAKGKGKKILDDNKAQKKEIKRINMWR